MIVTILNVPGMERMRLRALHRIRVIIAATIMKHGFAYYLISEWTQNLGELNVNFVSNNCILFKMFGTNIYAGSKTEKAWKSIARKRAQKRARSRNSDRDPIVRFSFSLAMRWSRRCRFSSRVLLGPADRKRRCRHVEIAGGPCLSLCPFLYLCPCLFRLDFHTS